MKSNIELLKDVLLNHQPVNRSMMTEVEFNQMVREDLHIPFIKAMDDAVSQYKNSVDVEAIVEDLQTTGENKFREKLNHSKEVS